MKQYLSRFLILLSMLVPAKLVACEVLDDRQQRVFVTEAAKRIITLTPDLTEIVFSLNSGDKIVGTVDSSDFPAGAKKIAHVGNYAGIDLEKIIALKPDLILTWGNSFAREIALLRKLRIPVYVNQPEHFLDITKSIRNIGCLLGKEETANVLTNRLMKQFARIKQDNHSHRSKKVFYQIGEYSFYTVNQSTWINDVIELCGGHNIFADLKSKSAEVDVESIITRDPEIIFASTQTDRWKKRWQSWKRVSAVKNDRLITISPDIIERPGPRLIQGAIQICKSLQSVT